MSNENSYNVIVHKISGTDPQKEQTMTLYSCSKESRIATIQQAIADIKEEIEEGLDQEENNLEYDCENDCEKIEEMKKLKTDYKERFEMCEECLDDLKNIPEYKVPNNYYIDCAHNDISCSSKFCKRKIHRSFNEPPEATLIAIDVVSSYDFHYYLGIQKFVNNKIEIIVHDH